MPISRNIISSTIFLLIKFNKTEQFYLEHVSINAIGAVFSSMPKATSPDN